MKAHSVASVPPVRPSERLAPFAGVGAQAPARAPYMQAGTSELLPHVELGVPAEFSPLASPHGRDDGERDSSSNEQSSGHQSGTVQDDEVRSAVAELSGLIAAFCLHPSAEGSNWSIRIPLDAPALKDCVLHMHLTHCRMSLRFETTDWDAKDALIRHGAELVEQLRSHLPLLHDIDIQE